MKNNISLNEENDLAQKAKNGCLASRDKLWGICEPYTRSICSKYAPHSSESTRYCEYSDMTQNSFLAFCEALEKWKKDDKARFSSYFHFWVKEYCRRELGISNSRRREPLLKAASLDMPLDESDDGDDSYIDFLVDESALMAYEEIEKADIIRIVREEISKLPERNRKLIHCHYYQNLMLKDIADIMNFSNTTASRILDESHDTLRKSEVLQFLYYGMKYEGLRKEYANEGRCFQILQLSQPEAALMLKETFKEDMAGFFGQMMQNGSGKTY